MTKADAVERLEEMEKKYCSLVWLARCYSDDLRDDNPAMPKMVEIQMKLKEECADLMGEEGDWHHGFNSGCLAAFRFAIGILGNKFSTSLAEEDFPFLDT